MDNSSTEKTDWTNEVILEFIQLYESYPVLWDPKHKNHKNRNSLFDAWQSIAKEISIHVTVDALRKKKESLMATYRILAKKVRDSYTTGSGAQDIYEPTWFAFHAIDRFIMGRSKKVQSVSSEEHYKDQFSEDDSSQSELTEQLLWFDQELLEQNNDDPLIPKMDWTNEVILEFIQLYESYPVLWDPKHKNHKNRNSLFDAWQSIAKEISIDVTVDALRKKKESLMATYRILAKKVRNSYTTGSGAQDIYEPTWFAFHAIDRFIKGTSKKVQSFSSEEQQKDQFSEDDSSQSELTEQLLRNDQDLSEQNYYDSLIQKKDIVSPRVPKKRGSPHQVESVSKHFKLASDALTSVVKNSQIAQMDTMQDAPALYGQLLAAKLRRLSKRTQLVLQNQIDNLVFQTELNEIDMNPGTSPSEAPSNIPSSPNCVNSPNPRITSIYSKNIYI